MDPFDSFVGVHDATVGPFEERRPGCAKRVIYQTDDAQASIYRLEPGCGVPPHRHSRADDLFVGLKGEAAIRTDGVKDAATFTLRAGCCCRVGRGVRHEVVNTSPVDVALFVLVHAPYKGFDHLFLS